MNEADTCRTLVLPKLQASGWEVEPYLIADQCFVTNGRRDSTRWRSLDARRETL